MQVQEKKQIEIFFDFHQNSGLISTLDRRNNKKLE